MGVAPCSHCEVQKRTSAGTTKELSVLQYDHLRPKNKELLELGHELGS